MKMNFIRYFIIAKINKNNQIVILLRLMDNTKLQTFNKYIRLYIKY